MANNILNSQGDSIATSDDGGNHVQRIKPTQPLGLQLDGTATCTSTTSEQDLLAAGGASVKNDLIGVVITNTSATGVEVELRDDPGGSRRGPPIYAPPNQTVGYFLPAGVVLKQTTANRKWTAKTVAGVASVTVTGFFLTRDV